MKNKMFQIIPKLVLVILFIISLFLTLLFMPIIVNDQIYNNQHMLINQYSVTSYSLVVIVLYFSLLILSYLLVYNIGKQKVFTIKNQKILKIMFTIALIESILLAIPIVIEKFIPIYGPPMSYLFVLLFEVTAISITCITYIFSKIIEEAKNLKMENDLTI